MLYKIFTKKHLSPRKRLSLFLAYLKIRFIRFAANRFFSADKIKSISILGYTFWINKFNDFYWTFMEIFIDEEYFFSTTENTPSILDLGGHIGVSTMYFKWLYPDAVITVFEPMPDNIKTLKRNIEYNKLSNVTLEEKAVGSTVATQFFYGEGRAGFVSPDAIDKQKTCRVSVTTLSPYITDPIAFCKMDIEGSEADVIKELSECDILHNIKHLVMEYHKKDCDNKLSDIIASFEKASMAVTFMGTVTSLTLKKRNFTHIMLVATHKI